MNRGTASERVAFHFHLAPNIGDASKNLGVQNLQQVLKQAEGLLR